MLLLIAVQFWQLKNAFPLYCHPYVSPTLVVLAELSTQREIERERERGWINRGDDVSYTFCAAITPSELPTQSFRSSSE